VLADDGASLQAVKNPKHTATNAIIKARYLMVNLYVKKN
jgi:hypothetical protein